MTWDDVLSVLVGFVGRKVHVQVWNAADPEADGSVVVLTAFGVLTDSDENLARTMPTDTMLVRLVNGAEASAVVSLSREVFRSATMLDEDRLEVTFAGCLLGVYAE